MSTRRSARAAAAVALSAALAAGCRDEPGGIRKTSREALIAQSMSTVADEEVVRKARAPAREPIVYDRPVDLSLANARRTRPDLVRPDTTRR